MSSRDEREAAREARRKAAESADAQQDRVNKAALMMKERQKKKKIVEETEAEAEAEEKVTETIEEEEKEEDEEEEEEEAEHARLLRRQSLRGGNAMKTPQEKKSKKTEKGKKDDIEITVASARVLRNKRAVAKEDQEQTTPPAKRRGRSGGAGEEQRMIESSAMMLSSSRKRPRGGKIEEENEEDKKGKTALVGDNDSSAAKKAKSGQQSTAKLASADDDVIMAQPVAVAAAAVDGDKEEVLLSRRRSRRNSITSSAPITAETKKDGGDDGDGEKDAETQVPMLDKEKGDTANSGGLLMVANNNFSVVGGGGDDGGADGHDTITAEAGAGAGVVMQRNMTATATAATGIEEANAIERNDAEKLLVDFYNLPTQDVVDEEDEEEEGEEQGFVDFMVATHRRSAAAAPAVAVPAPAPAPAVAAPVAVLPAPVAAAPVAAAPVAVPAPAVAAPVAVLPAPAVAVAAARDVTSGNDVAATTVGNDAAVLKSKYLGMILRAAEADGQPSVGQLREFLILAFQVLHHGEENLNVPDMPTRRHDMEEKLSMGCASCVELCKLIDKRDEYKELHMEIPSIVEQGGAAASSKKKKDVVDVAKGPPEEAAAVVGKTCQQEMSSIMFYNWCVEKMGGGREAGLQKYLEALRAKTPRGQSFWACFLLAAYNQLQLTLQLNGPRKDNSGMHVGYYGQLPRLVSASTPAAERIRMPMLCLAPLEDKRGVCSPYHLIQKRITSFQANTAFSPASEFSDDNADSEFAKTAFPAKMLNLYGLPLFGSPSGFIKYEAYKDDNDDEDFSRVLYEEDNSESGPAYFTTQVAQKLESMKLFTGANNILKQMVQHTLMGDSGSLSSACCLHNVDALLLALMVSTDPNNISLFFPRDEGDSDQSPSVGEALKGKHVKLFHRFKNNTPTGFTTKKSDKYDAVLRGLASAAEKSIANITSRVEYDDNGESSLVHLLRLDLLILEDVWEEVYAGKLIKAQQVANDVYFTLEERKAPWWSETVKVAFGGGSGKIEPLLSRVDRETTFGPLLRAFRLPMATESLEIMRSWGNAADSRSRALRYLYLLTEVMSKKELEQLLRNRFVRAEIAKEELGEYVERYKTMMYEMTTEELKEECQAFCVEY